MENQEHSWKSSAELVVQGFECIQEWMKKESDILGLDTGFEELNRILSGFQRGNVVMLGGRPAMGKTALMQNIILNVAKQGYGVGVFSLADSTEQFILRLICIKSSVSMIDIRNGNVKKETDLPKIKEACEDTSTLPIFVQDSSASADDIMERARILKQEQANLGLIVVDYIGLITATNHMLSRSEVIAETSRKFKMLAKELDVCVLVLSQLNRSLEQRLDKRPILSDLRGSGALEQDADVICFLYRDEYYNPQTPEKGQAEIIVAKQRNGPTGRIILQFEGQYLRFNNQNSDSSGDFF